MKKWKGQLGGPNRFALLLSLPFCFSTYMRAACGGRFLIPLSEAAIVHPHPPLLVLAWTVETLFRKFRDPAPYRRIVHGAGKYKATSGVNIPCDNCEAPGLAEDVHRGAVLALLFCRGRRC